jgi:RHS repeat-associated protein
VYYFHNDHLGTPQVMTDQAGRVVWQAEYDAFGKAAVNEDPDGDGKAVTNNLRFPGQYYDAETGLHYNYHRDYDPETGRYLQADPVGLEGGTNLYAYAFDNPVRFVDPFGLTVFLCEGKLRDYDHSWVCKDRDCAGLGPLDPLPYFYGDGIVLKEPFVASKCTEIPPMECCDQAKFEACVKNRIDSELNTHQWYGLLTHNCRRWAWDLLVECRKRSCSQ